VDDVFGKMEYRLPVQRLTQAPLRALFGDITDGLAGRAVDRADDLVGVGEIPRRQADAVGKLHQHAAVDDPGKPDIAVQDMFLSGLVRFLPPDPPLATAPEAEVTD